MIKIDNENKEVTLYLRDYLGPQELYPYDDLSIHCEKYLSQGYDVSVISVPGFLMIHGTRKYGDRPWSKTDNYKFKTYKTARDALRR